MNALTIVIGIILSAIAGAGFVIVAVELAARNAQAEYDRAKDAAAADLARRDASGAAWEALLETHPLDVEPSPLDIWQPEG